MIVYSFVLHSRRLRRSPLAPMLTSVPYNHLAENFQFEGMKMRVARHATSSNMAPQTCHHSYPSFPSDVPLAPLTSISLAKLEATDHEESSTFFHACKELGFFYLNLEGSSIGDSLVRDAETLHSVQQEFFRQPQEEKEKFAREKIDPFFGYRSTALDRTNEYGQTKATETYNMRKDDIIGNCPSLPMHPLAVKNIEVLRSFIINCRTIIDLLITQLEMHLLLPDGALANLHYVSHRSGDHVRFNQAAIRTFDEIAAKKAEHTDFGTLTILFNWLGGLQIRSPQTNDWVYVKPVPGSPIVNLGDALVKFTAGILRSNVHRVVPAPAPQNLLTRHSLVYFCRPEDAVVLKRLKGGLIDAQQGRREELDEVRMTAAEWTLRRSVGDLPGVFTHEGQFESRV